MMSNRQLDKLGVVYTRWGQQSMTDTWSAWLWMTIQLPLVWSHPIEALIAACGGYIKYELQTFNIVLLLWKFIPLFVLRQVVCALNFISFWWLLHGVAYFTNSSIYNIVADYMKVGMLLYNQCDSKSILSAKLSVLSEWISMKYWWARFTSQKGTFVCFMEYSWTHSV